MTHHVRAPVTPESITEGFKALDRLHSVADELVFGTLAEAALAYSNLLKGEVVDGQRLVEVDE